MKLYAGDIQIEHYSTFDDIEKQVKDKLKELGYSINLKYYNIEIHAEVDYRPYDDTPYPIIYASVEPKGKVK